MVVEMAHIFITELPEYQARLKTAIRNQSAKEIAFAAHKLRGGLALLGAEDAVVVASQMEHLAGDGNLSAAANALPDLESELITVARDLMHLLEQGVETAVRG
jgi:HPt (histidine-containing phosphotransfer) domain-containing protein